MQTEIKKDKRNSIVETHTKIGFYANKIINKQVYKQTEYEQTDAKTNKQKNRKKQREANKHTNRKKETHLLTEKER
jgi:hypothetical protein